MKKSDLSSKLMNKLLKDKRFTFIACGLLCALALLLYFAGGTDSTGKTEYQSVQGTPREGDSTEKRLAEVLSHIRGAGEVVVMVTYETTSERVTAVMSQSDSRSSDANGSVSEQRSETVQPATVTTDGGQEAIVLYEREPVLRGVIVVAEGAADLRVMLDLQRAVRAVTGLPLSAIEVFEMGYEG